MTLFAYIYVHQIKYVLLNIYTAFVHCQLLFLFWVLSDPSENYDVIYINLQLHITKINTRSEFHALPA